MERIMQAFHNDERFKSHLDALAVRVFENLPEPLNAEWTERLVSAIPVGKDLSLVLPKFLLRVLDRLPETDRKDVVDSINGVKEVLRNWADTGEVDRGAAAEAAEAAGAAARAAARAAEAAARAAAWAAWTTAWAAGAAAWAAGPAEAAEAAEAAGAAWEQIAADLIECIEEAA